MPITEDFYVFVQRYKGMNKKEVKVNNQKGTSCTQSKNHTTRPSWLMRRPGIEPGSVGWKPTMLTPTPATQKTVSAGLEPARAEPNRFQVYLLNRSDTTPYFLLLQ